MSAGVVIIGAGQAGYQTAESLRQGGYDQPITLIGEEPFAPYQRPPLSKAYLLGDVDKERLQFRSRDFYTDRQIDLRTDLRVTGIDRGAQKVICVDQTVLQYEALVLATGARVRPLAVPGAELSAIHYLKTLKDMDRIEERLAGAEKVVVIGAGFIGLEFAAVAHKLQKQVTVLEAAPRVMGRAVSPELSDFFAKTHQARGVQLLMNEGVTAIEEAESGVVVVGASGARHSADLVVVGIGVIPNVGLAEAAGLTCENGISVDLHCRTSDPAIFAAGDCASFVHPFSGTRIRLESVQNAADQGRITAASILGEEKSYDTVPWFWSDQFEFKLQMVGMRDGCDRTVLRGDMDSGKFSLFHFRGEALRAVESVNRPADHTQARKLLAKAVSPTFAQAADVGFKLKELL